MQHPQPAAVEGMLLYEDCLAPDTTLSFWAGTSCLIRTFLPPPSLQRAVSPRATGILGGGCRATASLSTSMGRKSTTWESAGPVQCVTWGYDHDTMWVTVTMTTRCHKGEGCKPLLSCHGASRRLFVHPTTVSSPSWWQGPHLPVGDGGLQTVFLSPPLPGKTLAGTAHPAHQRLLKSANKIAGSNRSGSP